MIYFPKFAVSLLGFLTTSSQAINFSEQAWDKMGTCGQKIYGLLKRDEDGTQTKAILTLLKSNKDQLDYLLEYAENKKDADVSSRVRTIIRQRDRQAVERRIDRWGMALGVVALANLGLVFYCGYKVHHGLPDSP